MANKSPDGRVFPMTQPCFPPDYPQTDHPFASKRTTHYAKSNPGNSFHRVLRSSSAVHPNSWAVGNAQGTASRQWRSARFSVYSTEERCTTYHQPLRVGKYKSFQVGTQGISPDLPGVEWGIPSPEMDNPNLPPLMVEDLPPTGHFSDSEGDVRVCQGRIKKRRKRRSRFDKCWLSWCFSPVLRSF